MAAARSGWVGGVSRWGVGCGEVWGAPPPPPKEFWPHMGPATFSGALRGMGHGDSSPVGTLVEGLGALMTEARAEAAPLPGGQLSGVPVWGLRATSPGAPSPTLCFPPVSLNTSDPWRL